MDPAQTLRLVPPPVLNALGRHSDLYPPEILAIELEAHVLQNQLQDEQVVTLLEAHCRSNRTTYNLGEP